MRNAPRPAILLLRTMILLAYAVLASPIALFFLTGWWGFWIIAGIFALAAVLLLPKAKEDWNYPLMRELWAGRTRDSRYSLWLNRRHRAIERTRMRCIAHRWSRP